MKYEYIETFLAVLNHGSIAKAADALYISQGTASTRIQQLEDELNVLLFYRQKGQRRIELTPMGEEFLPLAQQWLALWQAALALKNKDYTQELRVGGVDVINLNTLSSFYNYMIEAYPHLKLVIKTHHSSELYKQVDNQILDIGIGVNVYPYPNIESIPLYEEDLVLLCHNTHPYLKSGNIQDLSNSDEIYQHFSDEFQAWHQQYFKNMNHQIITIGTISMQERFLTNPKRWTITPYSFAMEYVKNHKDYVMSHFLNEPPKRTVYLLTYKYPRPGVKKATELFMDELLKYINSNPALRILKKKGTTTN